MDTARHILQVKGSFVWTISPDETVFEALRLMANKDVGALVVMQDEKMIGILSERDYARKLILQGKYAKDTYVREIMVTNLITIHPDQTVEECMELMTNHRVRHLPVVENDQLVGMVSIGDVVNNIIHRQRRIIKEMEKREKDSEEKPFEPVVPRFPSPPKPK